MIKLFWLFSIQKDFKRTRLLITLTIITLLNIGICLFFRYVTSDQNFYSECIALSKIVFFAIVFYSSLKTFRFIKSGMDKQAVSSIRSKSKVFNYIIVSHLSTTLVYSLAIIPSFIFSLHTFKPVLLIPSPSTFDIQDFLFSILLIVVYAKALSTPFIFYFKKVRGFLLGIYFIPQLIRLITLIPQKFLKVDFLQYSPDNILMSFFDMTIAPIALLFVAIYSTLCILYCKWKYNK